MRDRILSYAIQKTKADKSNAIKIVLPDQSAKERVSIVERG
jgi:hypothetical protein